MKKELQMRLAIAGFLQEALQALADKKKKNLTCSEDQASAQELIEFMEKARSGLPLPNETVIRMAKLFKDELTLANIARPQLVTMCRFMGLPPYGTDALLRFQVRASIFTRVDYLNCVSIYSSWAYVLLYILALFIDISHTIVGYCPSHTVWLY